MPPSPVQCQARLGPLATDHRATTLSGRGAALPIVCEVITGAAPQAIGPDNPVYKYIPIHIEEAIRAGEFIDVPVRVTLDMVGAGLITVARISSGRADDSYLGAMMSALARSLGLDQSRAAELVSEPVTALELDASLLLVQRHAPASRMRPMESGVARRTSRARR